MKIAKGITRKGFREKFGSKEQCLNFRETIFSKLIERMCNHSATDYKSIIHNVT